MPKKQKRRPETTLFLSSSVDGRLTGHDSMRYDKNRTWKHKPGIRSILQRFYDFRDPKTYAVTSGETMWLAGVNKKQGRAPRMNLSLVVLDHTSSLTPQGIRYLSSCIKKLYFIGSPNLLRRLRNRPKNLICIPYSRHSKLRIVAEKLYDAGVRSMTIHSDGPMNARWLAEDLIDSMTVVIAPLIVGDNGTPTIKSRLPFGVKVLQLVETRAIDGSYLFLRYTISPLT